MEDSPALPPAQPHSQGISTLCAVCADAYIVQFVRCKLFFVALISVCTFLNRNLELSALQ